MDVFRAGVTLWNGKDPGGDWREDFEESLVLAPLPEIIEPSPKRSLTFMAAQFAVKPAIQEQRL